MKIYKYEFVAADEVIIPIVGFVQLIKVGTQNPGCGHLCVWCAVLPEAVEPVNLKIRVFGTGHEIPEDVKMNEYVDSVMDGQFVWHVFLQW